MHDSRVRKSISMLPLTPPRIRSFTANKQLTKRRFSLNSGILGKNTE